MGLGTPPQMIEMYRPRVDMFDCVLPTRIARNGTAFTRYGTLPLKNAAFIEDSGADRRKLRMLLLQELFSCLPPALDQSGGDSGLRLVTLHNLHFYLRLMRVARTAILQGRFAEFREQFVANYRSNGLEAAVPQDPTDGEVPGDSSPGIALILAHVVEASFEIRSSGGNS